MATTTIEAPIIRDDQATPAAKGRWDTDATGAPVFYPFGRAFSGYRLTTAAAAQVRAAEERYRQTSSKTVKPVAGIVGVGLFYLLASIFGEHPVEAVAIFYASIAGIAAMDALARFASLRESLEGGSPVPASAAVRQKLLLMLGALALSLVVFWLILFLYELQLSSLAAEHPKETWFYPGIAGYIVFVAVGVPALFSGMVHFDKIAAKAGPQRTLLTFFFLALALFGAMAMLVYNFVNPKPSIVLSDYAIKCGWRHAWRDLSGVELSVSYRGKASAVVKLRPPLVRALGKSSDRCDISGLASPYEDVYRAIAAAYQPHADDP
jgi:uncharacterized membrane protein YuzA (DUF378 family)